ncbi:TonB-dependent receptor domain-containing protein [Nitrosovibrio sp. Nv17]|uniref:TonB-dependent receptor domain-containing protein n=1 Tax=Nitrosovibrio sp. Nv17 TaxID=1855339 RepID=UPI000908C7B0|nr:TonB-dependent receptor [Nitrosovibrio sp. Nv17]SFW16237.1 iron complex outermembrane recepter protein [Nitrosovibrio sp. Nv17]
MQSRRACRPRDPLSPAILRHMLAGACLVLAGNNATAQEVLPQINVSAGRQKEPLVETESLKWTSRPSSDAAEFLREKPEFSYSKIGGTSGTIYLRGLGGPRLGIVMNDSLEAAAANHGTDPATSYIQPDAHDHITVVKGPNSVLYGSNMGGLVIFNENPKKFEKPGVQGRLAGGLGSFGRRDLTADVTVGAPLAQLRGVVNFSRGDNYKDGSGREFFSFFKRHSGKLVATLTPTRDISAEFSAEQGDAQVAFPAFSLMGDGISFKREILGARFVVKNIAGRFRKLEVQFFDRKLDHLMDNFTLRPVTVEHLNPNPPPVITNTSRRTLTQDYRGRSARMAATFDVHASTEMVVGYEHRDEQYVGSNRSVGTFCFDSSCTITNLFSPFYDLHTINNSVFTEVTHLVDDATTIKLGVRRDYFHTASGEMRDFLGTTIYPTSYSQRDDVANSGFIRVEKEFLPATVGFISIANGERPASNLERASFNGFGLRKEKNREINLGLSISHPTWQGSVTVFGSRVHDYILIDQGIRSANVDVDRVGVEFDLIRQIAPNWKLFGNLAWIRAENLTGHGHGSVPLAQTPPLDSRFGVIFQRGTLTATLGGRAVMRQTRIDPGFGNSLGIDNPDPTPGFATANMSMSWKPIKQAQLSMGMDNIFGRTYYEHLSRRIGDVPPGFVNFGRLNEPGRTVWFRMVINM